MTKGPTYTNKFDIPDELFRILTEGRYPPKKHRFGVVSLVSPYRQRELERRYWNDLVIDASQLIYMLMGRAFHLVAQQAGGSNALIEQKLELKLGKIELVGKPDRVEGDLLKDYKTTSVWAAIRGVSPEWTAQMNVYSYLLKRCLGVHTSKCMAVAYFRDWSINKAKQGGNYPQCALSTFTVPHWPYSQTEEFIKERVEGHIAAQALSSDNLPLCTDSETWRKESKWAVMKKGIKNAKRVLDTQKEAEDWITEHVDSKTPESAFHIEERLGETPRCNDYCFVKQYCSQFAEEQ